MSRFLGKSKWGKGSKDDEASGAKSDKFKLSEDVNDFLKPSIDASAEKIASTRTHLAPKIDTSIAKRFPDAHDIKSANSLTARSPNQLNWMRKPPRRPGLAVAFVKTVPEIIGEGGDEALDPPAEVSRNKSKMPRSVSDRRPAPLDNGMPWPGTQGQRPRPYQGVATGSPPAQGNTFMPPQTMRRANTSHQEVSPAVLRKVASPPIREPSPPRRLLGRVPTSFVPEDTVSPLSPTDSDHSPLPRIRPAIETRGLEEPFVPSYTIPASPAFSKQRDMRANEGMALRRASAMFREAAYDENERDPQADPGFQPPSQYYNALVEANSAGLAVPSEVPPNFPSRSSPAHSWGHKASPGGKTDPSPFADPKYVNRHAGEPPPTAAPVAQNVAPIPTQSRPKQASAPSYMQVGQTPIDQQTRVDGPYSPQTYQDPPAKVFDQGKAPNFSEQAPLILNQSTHPPIAHGPPAARQDRRLNQTTLSRSIQPQSVPMPQPSHPRQQMDVPVDPSRNRDPTPLRSRPANPGETPGSQSQAYTQSVYPSGNTQQMSSPKLVDSPNSSFGSFPSHFHNTGVQKDLSYGSRNFNHDTAHNQSPGNSILSPPKSVSHNSSHGHNLIGTPAFDPSLDQSIKSPVTNLRQERPTRPGSSDSCYSFQRAPLSPRAPAAEDSAGDAALTDFASRVSHMKGVFRLTAEKERAAQKCSPQSWMRTALWWYLTGKAGLQVVAKQRANGLDHTQDLLIQPHVDLAKSWWIVSDTLEQYDNFDPQTAQVNHSPAVELAYSISLLKIHLKSLTATMHRDRLMPPHQSLIQGQDTRIWLEYPRFMPDAAAILSGNVSNSITVESQSQLMGPLEALALGDSRDTFCYGRYFVHVSVSTDDEESDRVILPCVVSMLRSKREYQASLVIASQTELINIRIDPRQSNAKGLTWKDVTWKSNTLTIMIHLPRGFDVTVRLQERDYHALWNLVDYARRVEHSLQTEENERLVHDIRLPELQYADSSNSQCFPADKVRGCMALVFERRDEQNDGAGMRNVHRGFRLLLITESGHKSLSFVSHEICRRGPLLFEFLTDASANGTTAMVLRIREDKRQCRILLVFPDSSSRQAFYEVLNGLAMRAGEAVISKTAMVSLNICPAIHPNAFSPMVSSPALQSLQWQRLVVANTVSSDQSARPGETVESESLRVIARHATGCITDRLNLSKGEMLLRIPCSGAPAIYMLRAPQADISMSVDTRHAAPNVPDGLAELLQLSQQSPTIRSFTFASKEDLHSFQLAITGWTVLYDGSASTFAISRRRMVVPIYHKWTASQVRIQIVQRTNIGGGTSITQVLAFMEDFSHADALCFAVKSTDVFESVKGDGKGKKWAVKMVDAKFALPPAKDKDKKEETEMDRLDGLRWRFVNLEGMEYAVDHDDITVGFETQEDRDRFAQALPAATSVTRMMTMRRRI
ncbi:Hypothetical protein R9X50_00450300 [Acrodontium crateriforme]|uniref:Uncharacterized protein n=1 Tax=Acrodontium crateriforme TaxID=150365 RepID=A0AAQ3M5K6_9PEZI|nr:Hypothetical protein R9X50_00450300 [Acrodontium crateriforme]